MVIRRKRGRQCAKGVKEVNSMEMDGNKTCGSGHFVVYTDTEVLYT